MGMWFWFRKRQLTQVKCIDFVQARNAPERSTPSLLDNDQGGVIPAELKGGQCKFDDGEEYLYICINGVVCLLESAVLRRVLFAKTWDQCGGKGWPSMCTESGCRCNVGEPCSLHCTGVVVINNTGDVGDGAFREACNHP